MDGLLGGLMWCCIKAKTWSWLKKQKQQQQLTIHSDIPCMWTRFDSYITWSLLCFVQPGGVNGNCCTCSQTGAADITGMLIRQLFFFFFAQEALELLKQTSPQYPIVTVLVLIKLKPDSLNVIQHQKILWSTVSCLRTFFFLLSLIQLFSLWEKKAKWPAA